MGHSDRTAATVACIVGVSACNAIVGLNAFHQVPCDECGDGGDATTGAGSTPETGAPEAGPPDGARDAAVDATESDGGTDASEDAGSGFRASEAGSSVDLRWPRWRMPNGGGPDAGLPNAATYTLISKTDGGVLDAITGLAWGNLTTGVYSLTQAKQACSAPWRLPTRIELVSILDTSNPADSGVLVNAAFAQMPPARVWTSSVTPGGAWWTVDFSGGTVAPSSTVEASAAICIYVGDDAGAP
jgi:hypothetical protein